MKKLYEFVVTQKRTVKESKTEKNEKGQEITTTTDVEKLVDLKFFLKKPTRKLFDSAELYYAVQLSEGIKAGLLTRPLLAKRFNNDGGILSDEEKNEFQTLYDEIFEHQVEAQVLALKPKDTRTKEEEKRYSEIKEFLRESRKKLQEFELARSTLYDQTAENRARNKTIFWWVLSLAHKIDKDGIEEPFFGDGTFEEKSHTYDEIEELEDEYEDELVQKFFYYTSFWYVSKTNNKDELQKMLEMADNDDMTGLEELEKLSDGVLEEAAAKNLGVQSDEEASETPSETPSEAAEASESPSEAPEGPSEAPEAPVVKEQEPAEEPNAPEGGEEKK
jgi:hypothetical protein